MRNSIILIVALALLSGLIAALDAIAETGDKSVESILVQPEKAGDPFFAGAAAKHPNLVVEWKFEGTPVSSGTAYDTSGLENDGTVVNCGTQMAGKYGQCLFFDGSDDYVQNLGVNINLQNDATVLAWAYYDGVYADGASHYILEINDAVNDNRALILKAGGNAWSVWWEGNSVAENVVFDGSSYANKWTLFDLRKSGSDLSLILDGVIVATENTTTTNHNANCTELTIGANDSGSYVWPGPIDEVRIYDYALSESDIKRVMMGFQPIGSE